MNANLKAIGATLLNSPPADQLVTDPGGIILAEPTTSPRTLTVTTTYPPQTAEAIVICAKRPQPPGRGHYSTKSVPVLQIIRPGTGGPWNVTAAYNNKFLVIPGYYGIVFTVYFVRSTNGAKSLIYPAVIVPL